MVPAGERLVQGQDLRAERPSFLILGGDGSEEGYIHGHCFSPPLKRLNARSDFFSFQSRLNVRPMEVVRVAVKVVISRTQRQLLRGIVRKDSLSPQQDQNGVPVHLIVHLLAP